MFGHSDGIAGEEGREAVDEGVEALAVFAEEPTLNRGIEGVSLVEGGDQIGGGGRERLTGLGATEQLKELGRERRIVGLGRHVEVNILPEGVSMGRRNSRVFDGGTEPTPFLARRWSLSRP
jgi:hypothetical protein